MAKQEKIKKAANDAGLFNIVLVDEPSAAAMCYCANGNIKENGIYLVYDFGGGTFDTALVQYYDGKINAVGSPHGIDNCGGIDIDRLIYADMLAVIPSEIREKLSENKSARMRFEAQLAEYAVEMKHQLSSTETATEYITVGFDDIEYELTRDKLNCMIAGMIEQTVDCCRGVISANKKNVNDLGGILLVGGTSRVPLVKDMLRKLAGDVPIYSDADLELAVAQGAVVYDMVSGIENYPPELRDMVIRAQMGDIVDQFNLGYMYEYGKGVNQDYAEAVKWYRKSAEQGYAYAQNNLGYMYEYGKGVNQDYAEAVKWYTMAAEQGNATAQNNLGIMYEYGKGVNQDYAEAVKWYTMAAEQGDAYAQNNLGVMYDNGTGVNQDYYEAVKWFKKAAEQGHATAQKNLNIMYKNGRGC